MHTFIFWYKRVYIEATYKTIHNSRIKKRDESKTGSIACEKTSFLGMRLTFYLLVLFAGGLVQYFSFYIFFFFGNSFIYCPYEPRVKNEFFGLSQPQTYARSLIPGNIHLTLSHRTIRRSN